MTDRAKRGKSELARLKGSRGRLSVDFPLNFSFDFPSRFLVDFLFRLDRLVLAMQIQRMLE